MTFWCLCGLSAYESQYFSRPFPVLGRGLLLLKTVQGAFGGGEKQRGHDTGKAVGNDKDQERTHQR